MNEFKREDYIYLRFLEDDEENLRKKGDIVRYRKEWLLEAMRGRRFNDCFNEDTLILTEDTTVDENEIMFNKVYKSIVVAEEWQRPIYLWPDDYLYLDDWLFSHLDQRGIDLVTSLQSDVLPNRISTNKLIKLKEGCPYVDGKMPIYFTEGEKIDFSIPDVAVLFYNPTYLKLFAKTEVIIGEEKEQLFQEDFSNAIYVKPVSFSTRSFDLLEEHHYFKLKDDIKVKKEDEIAKLLGLSYLLSSEFNVIRNEQGFINHICTITSTSDNSDRVMEQNILKIADRISRIEALEIHKKACSDYIQKKEQEHIEIMKRIEEEKRKLDEAYQEVKNNPEIFPGVNGDFVHVNKKLSVTNEKHTLEQIKKFYQKLKTLNPEIVKHICFYGGTIPYILNNASESRDFGDIDMFVPTEYMEELREEFAHQESFEMLCDSKPYAESCMLTTRIAKESTEITLRKQQSDYSETQVLFEAFTNFMIPKEYKRVYIDINGIVHNPLNEYKESQLPYYRKVQDFGFKAKLFGINISVFPIYEYENNIMAKSFNINEMYRFLLGVKVLNNTKISEFIKQVNIYDSIFNILPLEYTLASKQSAVDGNYSYRYEKDKEDVQYILSHRDELGINDEKLQEILANYPDYSISIAYGIHDNGTTTTIGGKTYKELVLTNRHLS